MRTGKLFGNLFVAYDDEAFKHSVELFAMRFRQNGFDLNWFAGKNCLDAGCGGGRYSIALAQLGAKYVLGVDLSKEGIADAKNRSRELKCSSVEFKQCSVDSIPVGDAEFDCVVHSGVLMHTKEPLKVIREIARVLKSGGMLYGLVYATEGIRWPLVQILRPIAQIIGFEQMDQALIQAGMSVNRRRTYLDDLFVPYIDFYSWQCLSGLLQEIGFEKISRWNSGRLDHEEDINAYANDINGFLKIFLAIKQLLLTTNHTHQEIAGHALDICYAADEYVRYLAEQVQKSVISSEAARKLVIGQGHHRFIAWKK